MAMTVRAAVVDDFAVIRVIERSAGEIFDDIGMHTVADAEPSSLARLEEYTVRQHAWVLTDDDGAQIGFALVDVVDGCAHIEQISIHRDHHHHGYGRMLIAHIAALAHAGEMSAVTLSTFRDVPWNAPYYERCGFRQLTDAELTPGLVEVRAHEASQGLDVSARVCMRLDLS